jgi:hypothetical protein
LSATPSSTTEGALTSSEQRIAEAIAFRKQYGLRADERWVRDVAADPAAQRALALYGVPLLPSELADLQGRRFDLNVLDEVRAYGNVYPQDYAGSYFDQAVNGVAVSFKDRVDQHRVALTNLLGESVRLDVRKVDWSSRDLREFVRMVDAEEPWFETIGAVFQVAGRRVTEDFVYVQYMGNPELAGLIKEHFGNPIWLKAEWMGPLPWTGPRGNLVIVAKTAKGAPVAGLWCQIVPEDPMVEGQGDGISGSDEYGRCVFRNVPASSYRVRLHEQVADTQYEQVAETRAVLSGAVEVVPLVIPDP